MSMNAPCVDESIMLGMSAEIARLKARMREMVILMETDAAFGSITIGETRAAILKECRELVGDIPPPKTMNQILYG